MLFVESMVQTICFAPLIIVCFLVGSGSILSWVTKLKVCQKILLMNANNFHVHLEITEQNF